MRVLAHLININAAFWQPRFVDCFSAFYGCARLEYDLDGEAGGVFIKTAFFLSITFVLAKKQYFRSDSLAVFVPIQKRYARLCKKWRIGTTLLS